MEQGKGPPATQIFINYRRDDAASDAGRLYDALSTRFGGNSVFMDVDAIPPGADFAAVINQSVASCDVLVTVIGKNWVGLTDASGRRRLDDEQDLVRLEIEAALERNIRVIPALVQGADMPRLEQLPASIAKLAGRQAFEISHSRWKADVERLITTLEKPASLFEGDGRPGMTVRRESKLPRFPNQFVGRGRDIEQLLHRFNTSSMITLTGSGGMGKTRLAVELSAKLSERYRDGVVFIDLAPLTDESLIPRTIAWSLGLRDDGVRDPMDVVVVHLSERSVLLVLDNCEHVLSTAATTATELLSQCPRLSILATSREALGVQGETVWEVHPLPKRRDGSDPDDGDAVELFRLRAEASAPQSFVWDHRVAGEAARICHKLDGIPLAIELAAARLRVMPLGDLIAGLEERFALLTTGTRNATPRQQSLEATVDWSYQLLSAQEQSLLKRLAVFAGGFTRDAAEKVCGFEQLPRANVVPTLFGLVEKSLVRYETGFSGAARYTMLETIREFSRNKLQVSGDAVETHSRHAAHLSTVASPTEVALRSARQVEWLARLEEEHDNFRTAIEWALEADPALALEIVIKLGEFWMRRHIGEGTMWVQRATEAAAPTGELRAGAVYLAGQMAWLVGDQVLSRALLGEAAKRWTALGDVPRAGHAADLLATVHFESGDRDLALKDMDRVIALLRPTGDRWSLASALNNLGFFLQQVGDSLAAMDVLDEALEIARQAGDPWMVGIVLDSVANAEGLLGRYDEAREHWKECFSIAIESGNSWAWSYLLEGRARLALLEQDPALCVRLAAAGDAARRSIGAVSPGYWSDMVAAAVEAARGQLSEAAADTAWREGQTMTAQEIMAAVIAR
ncbi:MAG: hypothetical protein AUI42_00050 [Actinobacteria bacterium 13_1_40CM_2_65_8]|nr:MAG: hypothetical protein AUI42_00050 [Actinobacteria bacterium 13_1_40CM_2_65_8]